MDRGLERGRRSPRAETFSPLGVTSRCRRANPASVRQRQERDEDRGGEHALRAVDLLGEDRRAQRVQARDRRDDRRREHGHDGDADAAEDRRQRERPLDLADDLKAAEALPAGGIDELGIDLAHPDVRVREDRRDRQQRQGEGDVPKARPEERDAEADDRQRRNRAADVRDADRQQLGLAEVAEPQPDRHRDGDRDHDRQEGDGEVVAGQMAHLPEAADLHRAGVGRAPLEDEPDGVAERREDRGDREDHAAARRHGVSSRWTLSTRKSSAAASSVRMIPQTRTLPRKSMSESMFAPRPPAPAR